jgi:hypothetical protein
MNLLDTWQTHALVRDPSSCLKLLDCDGISPIAAATMSVNPATALRMVLVDNITNLLQTSVIYDSILVL